MITGKVKNILWVKERTGWANGSVFYFSMEMEDWSKVNIWKKSETAIKVWDELKYDIVSTDEYGVNKIKEVKEEFKKSQSYSKNYEADFVSFAMSYAKDLVIWGKVDIKDLTTEANEIYNWMLLQYKTIGK